MQRWIAVAPPGLEPVVARELADSGFSGHVEPGVVRFRAELAAGARLAAALRTPAHLRVLVCEGRADGFEALARLVRGADWRPYLHRQTPVAVRVAGRGRLARLRDALARKVGFALRDVQRRLPPARARGAEPEQRVFVRLDGDRATVQLDAGGEPLHRRGWRAEAGGAPLRENLAAAVLTAAGWAGDEALLDPFCGSGTFSIEAALLALDRPPGAGRVYAAWSWPAVDLAPPRPAPRAAPPVPVVGADRDPRVLLKARANADRARVIVDWRQLDVAEVEPPAPTGLVVANPPYGARLGARVAGVYSAFGRVLAERFGGWRCAFLAPQRDLARRVHPAAERLTTFSNGGIRVGLYALDDPAVPRR